MENQLIATTPMVQTLSPLGMEIEPLKKPETVNRDETAHAIFENRANKAAKAIKRSGRDKSKKAQVMLNFKLEYPEVDLKSFVASMCANNFDDDNFENKENFDIAEEVENHLNLKKLVKKVTPKKVLAVATGGASLLSDKKTRQEVVKVGGKVLKVAAPVAAVAASVIGTPALGAGVGAALGAAAKLATKVSEKAAPIVSTAKALGINNKTIEKIVTQPTKVPVAVAQAVVPTTGVEKTLAPLIIFKEPMAKALAAKGTSTTDKTTLEDLVGMFHQKIVLGKSNFDEKWCMNGHEYTENWEYFDENHLDASMAGQVVNDIVAFFKKAKAEPTTPTEKIIADEVIKSEAVYKQEKAQDIAEAIVNNEVKAKGFSMQHILIFAVIAIGAFLIIRK